MPVIGFFRRRIAGCLAIVAAVVSAASAQPPGGFSGGYRPNPDEIVDRLDENRNGQADPDEMQGRARFFLEGLARDNGLDLSKPIKNDKLKELLRARWGGGSSSGSSSRSASKPSPPAVATPGVLGFGAIATGTPATVPGFGPPPSADSWDVIREKYGRRVMEEVEEDMGRYDRNKDGVIDKEELKDGRWRGDPLEYDRNKDGKLSRSEMADREVGRSSSSSSSSSSSGSSSSGGYGYGGGSGFGGGQAPMFVMGGGYSYGSGSSSTGTVTVTPASGGSSSSGGTDDRYVRYAEGMIRQYDADKDGRLQKSEWSQMRGEPQKADQNGDGIITKDELAKQLANYGKGSSSSSSSGGGSASSGSSSSGGKSASNGERKSYRFLTPAERLPEGLPDWFAAKDADADGQIAMAEFATTWNDAKAKEFADWDRNGDGVLTPAECLKK